MTFEAYQLPQFAMIPFLTDIHVLSAISRGYVISGEHEAERAESEPFSAFANGPFLIDEARQWKLRQKFTHKHKSESLRWRQSIAEF